MIYLGTCSDERRGLSHSLCSPVARNGFFSCSWCLPESLPESPTSRLGPQRAAIGSDLRDLGVCGQGQPALGCSGLLDGPQGQQGKILWRVLLSTSQGRLKTRALDPDRPSLNLPPALRLHNPCFELCPRPLPSPSTAVWAALSIPSWPTQASS